MEGVVVFSGRHGDWRYSKRAGDELLPFLADIQYLANTRADYYLESCVDLTPLINVLDDIIRTRDSIDKAVSSAVRSRSVASVFLQILDYASSEYGIEKKQKDAFKDILKVYAVRYVLKQKIGDFEHLTGAGEDYDDLPFEGYQFVANRDGWIVVKKQRITEHVTPVDLLFYFVSLDNTLHAKVSSLSGITAQKLRPSEAYNQALELSDGGKDVTRFDVSFRLFMDATGFPIHYGIAYERIRPPKRIRGIRKK